MKTLASKLYQRVTHFTLAFVVAVSSLAAIGPFVFSSAANATASIVNIDTAESFATIKQAVQDADTTAGHTIEVSGSLDIVNDRVTVNKDLTIRGVSGAVINTTGTASVFLITANGVTIEGFDIIKSDNTDSQTIIEVQASNVTIQNNDFTGQFIIPVMGATSRAMVVSNGVSGLLVNGNTFTNLRQPAYINNFASGSITNNYATGTRGWVVEKATNFSFSGNTWGINTDDTKRVDIAIIPGSNAAATANNYTCQLDAIVAANNGAVVEDQHPAVCPDVTPPTFSISNLSNGQVVGTVATNKLTINGTFTDPSGGYVELQLVKPGVGSVGLVTKHAPVENGMLAEFDVTGFTTGQYQLAARPTDYLGNALPQQTITFTLDTTAPAIYFQLQPPSVISDTFHVRTRTNGETGLINKFVYINSETPENLCANSHSTHFNHDVKNTNCEELLASLAENTQHKFIGVAIDAGGNKSVVESNTFTIDRTGPTITVKPESIGGIGGSATFQNVSFKLYDKNKVDKVEINGVVKDLTNSQWSDVNGVKGGVFGALANQENTIVAYDVLGNTTTFTFTLDTTKPIVTVNTLVPNAPTITGGVTDASSTTVKVTINGTPYNATVNGSTWTVSTPELADGFYSVSAQATDAAGNIADSNEQELKIDTTPPTVEINPFAVFVTNDTTPTITGTFSANDANADTTIFLFIDGSATGIEVTDKNIVNGTWSYTLPAPLSQGTHSFVARAYDSVGNEDISSTRALTIDSTAPALAITSSTVEGDAVTISGIAETGAVLSATFNGVTSTISNNNGSWTFTADNLANGTYDFTITATDEAGNSAQGSTDVAISVFALDTTPALNSPAAVLGNDTGINAEEDDTDVAGASTDQNVAAVDTDPTDGTIFGLAWYWWLLILAALAAAASWIVAALRRRSAES